MEWGPCMFCDRDDGSAARYLLITPSACSRSSQRDCENVRMTQVMQMYRVMRMRYNPSSKAGSMRSGHRCACPIVTKVGSAAYETVVDAQWRWQHV
jgi:hypothetical protein